MSLPGCTVTRVAASRDSGSRLQGMNEDTMTAEETVREAVRLLRERISAAPRGPWKRGDRFGIWTTDEAILIVAGAATNSPATSDYIASMHPVFGAAAADALEAMVNSGDRTQVEAAAAAARAYLGI